MGRLDKFVDLTGTMSQTELQGTQITHLVDEVNRSQDLLDSLSSNLKIIARGKITDTWDGTAGSTNTLNIPINTGSGFTFLCYYSRSDLPDALYMLPNYLFDLSGNIQFYVFSFSNSKTLTFQWFAYQAGLGFTWTFYYFILQNPVNVVST